MGRFDPRKTNLFYIDPLDPFRPEGFTRALGTVASPSALAADTTLAILLRFHLLYEDENVPYVYLPSKTALGDHAGPAKP
ncbi:hypothetical protein M430DRAFT_18530 [Amorphotheca resinae ATCC 22711]|uniref:Uncharacterized protein n=1 Tax=Amorphotheca resinae ATCC 22711 TaxID=857342 RepID=A0A2T3B405_AMORE|nr:hypothetical protein M430DRAFT_18530 [Amorphotheca resinae ATCC 22711]PSS20375.1 hypothetical protein M430DRAFT_18530 [Amorphotheca resinae ATCC 22711]